MMKGSAEQLFAIAFAFARTAVCAWRATHQPIIHDEASQDYGYVEQGGGVTDLKRFGNDYNRNRSDRLTPYAKLATRYRRKFRLR